MQAVARGAVTIIVVIAVCYAGLVALAWAFQRQLIYLPDSSAPAPAGTAVEEVSYTTDDGVELDGWFMAVDDPHSVIVVANGNAGNRAARLPLAEALAERGHATLLTDYRGYGGNSGSPDEDGLVADLRAAASYVRDREDADTDRIVYLGESIGSGAVAGATVTEPPAAVILRSPFPALTDVGSTHYPVLPVGLLLRDRFPVTEQLAGYDGPVLVVAGGADRIVPTGLSREVAADLDAEQVEIAGADHNDRDLLDGGAFIDAVDGFVRSHLD